MDDNDTICPLCCEELDMSDRQFFPCKCGYQVCMWCWHRIREQETGLCPACRTPYGDDPHEFSAVDMQEVLKANKEKAAAEKRDKERQRLGTSAAGNTAAGWIGSSSVDAATGASTSTTTVVAATMVEGDGNNLTGARGTSHLEAPKDRNVLANKRVIRRNLVYAVGFPLSIATEDVLKKPEYLGQYGKISKIVLNRNHTVGTDSRRASASAYVTFVHKEDALACVIALDGFYLDGRNIRASYGTSKYCSAFIKNLKCSNPDCTYLHAMGDAEDTFSKQEIQAGYVTSGRDVLARQQQMAAAIASSTSRKKVGGGGPSGTGKMIANPVFPPPTFEEPYRSSQIAQTHPLSSAQFPPVNQQHQFTRSMSGIPSGYTLPGPLNKAPRSQSLSAVETIPTNDFDDDILECDEVNYPTFTSIENSSSHHPQGISFKGDVSFSSENLAEGRHSLPSSAVSSYASNGPTTTTAASVVAGMHTVSKPVPPPPPSLTTLTPLKRASSMTSTSTNSVGPLGLTKSSVSTGTSNPNVQDASIHNRGNLLKTTLSDEDSPIKSNTLLRNGLALSPSSSISSNGPTTFDPSKILHFHESESDASIGGAVIGSNRFPLFPVPSCNSGNHDVSGPMSSTTTSLNLSFDVNPFSGPSLGVLGMNSTTSHLSSGTSSDNRINSSSSSYLGSVSFDDKWDAETGKGTRLFVGDNDLISSGMISSQIVRENSMSTRNLIPSVIGPPPQQVKSNHSGVIGGGRALIGGATLTGTIPSSSGLTNGNFLNLSQSTGSGSSMLASMLGIELPTGSGSLRDSLWDSSQHVASTLSSKSSMQPPPPIGSGIKAGSDVILGHGPSVTNANLSSSSSAIGGNRNSSDIALLQSLLPGVTITSGNVYQPTVNMSSTISNTNNANGSNFNSTSWFASGTNASTSMDRSMTGHSNPGMPMHPQYGQLPQQNKYEQWGNVYASTTSAPQKLNGNSSSLQIAYHHQQQQQQGHSTNIW